MIPATCLYAILRHRHRSRRKPISSFQWNRCECIVKRDTKHSKTSIFYLSNIMHKHTRGDSIQRRTTILLPESETKLNEIRYTRSDTHSSRHLLSLCLHARQLASLVLHSATEHCGRRNEGSPLENQQLSKVLSLKPGVSQN